MPEDLERFAAVAPKGLFSLRYPASWKPPTIGDPLSEGAVFAAVCPDGEAMLEIFEFNPKSLEFYAGMCEEDQREAHPDTRLVEKEPYDLPAGPCLRVTLAYHEATRLKIVELFYTDYFLVDTEGKVLSLNFKVSDLRYRSLQRTIEEVVKSLRFLQ